MDANEGQGGSYVINEAGERVLVSRTEERITGTYTGPDPEGQAALVSNVFVPIEPEPEAPEEPAEPDEHEE